MPDIAVTKGNITTALTVWLAIEQQFSAVSAKNSCPVRGTLRREQVGFHTLKLSKNSNSVVFIEQDTLHEVGNESNYGAHTDHHISSTRGYWPL